ncbi:MAG: hypothetical protein QM729_01475 [Solirubrobacterales bacterium]
MTPQGTCAVCGRTILDGEQVHHFVSAEGHHRVCPLCAARAGELGWLPADQAGAAESVQVDTERKPGFFARLFSRPEGAERPGEDFDDEGLFDDEHAAAGERAEEMPAPAPDAPHLATHELQTERYDVEAEWAVEDAPAPHGDSADLPAPPEPLPDPAGRGMRPRRLQPDTSPGTRFERAIARFNSGDAGRTVAGLTRTLGSPSVSVGDLAGEEDIVRVTVAWELTWYQWGVDLGDELRPVFELAKGFEIDEIDAAARQWNASAHDGRVVMVAPGRREATDGRPVHR